MRSHASRDRSSTSSIDGLGAPLHARRAREIEKTIAGLEAKLTRTRPTRDRRLARDHRGRVPGLAARDLAHVDPALDELWTSSSHGGDPVALIDTSGSLSRRAAGRDGAHRAPRVVGEAIARLPERGSSWSRSTYYEELTLREIGEVLGVTESRVSQLHTKAILRLKAHSRRRSCALARLAASWVATQQRGVGLALGVSMPIRELHDTQPTAREPSSAGVSLKDPRKPAGRSALARASSASPDAPTLEVRMDVQVAEHVAVQGREAASRSPTSATTASTSSPEGGQRRSQAPDLVVVCRWGRYGAGSARAAR